MLYFSAQDLENYIRRYILMKKKKHFLSMILGLALSLTILFPSFAQASEILV